MLVRVTFARLAILIALCTIQIEFSGLARLLKIMLTSLKYDI